MADFENTEVLDSKPSAYENKPQTNLPIGLSPKKETGHFQLVEEQFDPILHIAAPETISLGRKKILEANELHFRDFVQNADYLPTSPEMKSAETVIEATHREYFQSLGFSDSAIAFLPVKELIGLWKIQRVGATMTTNGIILLDPYPIPQNFWGEKQRTDYRELNFYMKALMLAHEKYHSTATLLYSLTSDDNYTYPLVKHGFSLVEKGATSSALEEGLARLAEFRAEPVLRQLFPLGAVLYDDCIQKDWKHLVPDSPDELPHIAYNPEIERLVYYRISPKSLDLVRYLHDRIPNFELLAEDARFNHRIAPLALAIGKKFNSASYKDIMTATEENAGQVKMQIEQTARKR